MADHVFVPELLTLASTSISLFDEQKRTGSPFNPEWLGYFKVPTRSVHLSWAADPVIGLPTQPYRVWRASRAQLAKLFKPLSVPVVPLQAYQLMMLAERQVAVSLKVTSNGPGGLFAFAAGAYESAMVDAVVTAAGASTVVLSGAAIRSITVTPNVTVQEVRGLNGQIAATADIWTPQEDVGFPIDKAQWTVPNGYQERPQGMVATPTTPVLAAIDRFRRAGARYGWPVQIAPGVPAPPWNWANPNAMIAAMAPMLQELREVWALPQSAQAGYAVKETARVENNLDGALVELSGPVLALLGLGVAADPDFAVIAGFRTAYEDILTAPPPPPPPGPAPLPVGYVPPAAAAAGPPPPYSYMVTGRWGAGIGFGFLFGSPLSLAGIAYAPSFTTPPAAPTGLATRINGYAAPGGADQPWSPIATVAFDKVPDNPVLRVASYALVRAPAVPPQPPVPLMEPRPGDPAVLHPIGAVGGADGVPPKVLGYDNSYAIRSTGSPNILHHAVAQQDAFGRWGPWGIAQSAVEEPAPQQVPILLARLDVTVASPGQPCPATLVVEFGWDWRARQPRGIRLIGQLYVAAQPGQAPVPVPPVPAGLQRSIGGVAQPFEITFFGDAAQAPPGATIEYVSPDGKTVLATPPVDADQRRYRATIPGFTLDFAGTGHVGLVLWASGNELLRPALWSATAAKPAVVTASDPRPPVMPVPATVPEDVVLASVADARAEHHLRLTWPPAPAAAGYFVYQANEARLRDAWQMGDPPVGYTHRQRLAELREALKVRVGQRDVFTRLNARPLAEPGMAVTLPRGSREIMLHTAIGVGAGGVESAWPTDPKSFQAHAAPVPVLPEPPSLEAMKVEGGVKLIVRTRPGAPVSRILLHRTRVPAAATEIDTMGPPLATLAPGQTAGWELPDGEEPIGRAIYIDAPEPSWRPVYYRAVAWAADDPARAERGGRSRASAAARIVVPPPGPPPLSPIQKIDVSSDLVDFAATTTVPVERTEMGDHRIEVTILRRQGTTVEEVFRHPFKPEDAAGALAAVSRQAPVWPPFLVLEAGGKGEPSRLRMRLFKSQSSSYDVRFQLTDPLGRSTVQVLAFETGQPPMLTGASAAGIAAITVEAGNADQATIGIALPLALGAVPPFALPLAQVPLGAMPPAVANAFAVRRWPAGPGRWLLSIVAPPAMSKKLVAVTLTNPDGLTASTLQVLG